MKAGAGGLEQHEIHLLAARGRVDERIPHHVVTTFGHRGDEAGEGADMGLPFHADAGEGVRHQLDVGADEMLEIVRIAIGVGGLSGRDPDIDGLADQRWIFLSQLVGRAGRPPRGSGTADDDESGEGRGRRAERLSWCDLRL